MYLKQLDCKSLSLALESFWAVSLLFEETHSSTEPSSLALLYNNSWITSQILHSFWLNTPLPESGCTCVSFDQQKLAEATLWFLAVKGHAASPLVPRKACSADTVTQDLSVRNQSLSLWEAQVKWRGQV